MTFEDTLLLLQIACAIGTWITLFMRQYGLNTFLFLAWIGFSIMRFVVDGVPFWEGFAMITIMVVVGFFLGWLVDTIRNKVAERRNAPPPIVVSQDARDAIDEILKKSGVIKEERDRILSRKNSTR